MPDHHVAVGRVARRAHLQRVVHQRPDVVAAVGGHRRGHVAAHERCDHPVPGRHQRGGQLAEAVCGVGKTVQAQGDRAVGRSPGERANLHRRAATSIQRGSGIVG